MLKHDYKKLYLLQDKFLKFWKTADMPFYLTGETALGRYYLNHRYSEDLDFFVNNRNDYKQLIEHFSEKLYKNFPVEKQNTLIYEGYSRFYIRENDTFLKLEFVNDVNYHAGNLNEVYFGKIDTPLNILSNKLTAILNRDEPKDIFDIIHISLNYKFNWSDIFFSAKEKAMINEIDVEQRINNFPTELFERVSWFTETQDFNYLQNCIKTIANDFIIGTDNSLSKTNILIENAQVDYNQ